MPRIHIESSKLPWCLAFAALGLLGNYLALPIGFNVDFIFGSVFGIMAIILLGAIPGVSVSLAAASYTFVLWNHPYAIAIFLCEAICLALVIKNKPKAPLILIDALFWAFLGVPLVFLFYYGVMNLGAKSASIVAMKQSLNGITNSVLASVLLTYIPLRKWTKTPLTNLPNNSRIFFESTAFLLLLPCIGGLIFMNHREIKSSQEHLSVNVARISHEVESALSGWLSQHLGATKALAELGQDRGFVRTEALQRETAAIHALFPDFHNVFIADGNSTTLAFDPPVNERGESTIGINFSDREWFKSLKETSQPVISDIFMGRGGVFKPIFSISTPIVKDGPLVGFGLGAMNLEPMEKLIGELVENTNMRITITDRKGEVIVSSDKSLKPLSKYTIEASEEQNELVPGVHLSIPELKKNVSVMQKWKGAAYFVKLPHKSSGWTIIVEGPLASLQQSVYDNTILNMAADFIILFATGVISLFISGRLSWPMKRLAATTIDIPNRIESGEALVWPDPETEEISVLTRNFSETSEALRGKINSLRMTNNELEAEVARRTADLEKTTQEAKRDKDILQGIFDSAPVAIVWTANLTDIKFTNKRFFSDIGYSSKEIPTMDKWFETAYPDPAYREELVAKWSKMESEALENGATSFGPLEAWVQCGDGKRRCFDIYGSTLPDSRLAIFSDITERKASEEKLEALNKSQKILLSEVNHRVKNNLAVLIGMLHLEARTRKDDQCRALTLEIENRIQALSKVHSMLSSSEWHPIRLQHLCEQIIAYAIPREMNPQIRITPSDVKVDSSQAHNLALVLNELATNSGKYARASEGISITVEIEAENAAIRIRYHDNGPGYPQTVIDGEATKDAGIGIQLIKGIVEGSLYGKVSLSNQGGAVADIEIERIHWEENNYET